MAKYPASGTRSVPPAQHVNLDGHDSGPPHPGSEQDSQSRQVSPPPSSTAKPVHANAPFDFVTLLRRLGAFALLVAAIAIWFGMAPDVPNQASKIASIEATDDANNARAEGAPQQTVVNGWTTIEYLQLLAQQSDELASASVRDDRPGAMLAILGR